MMKLCVPFDKDLLASDSLTTIAHRLNKIEKHALEYTPWPQFDYKPQVYFSMCYGVGNMYLQYQVREEDIAAANGKTNSPVYEDSCVEFFISFPNSSGYYNFEFNCIGTVLGGYGAGKTDRAFLPEEVLNKISYQVIHNKPGALRMWELTVVIPFDVLIYDSFSTLQGTKARANFYKCGDNLPKPHFVSWSDIQSDTPDFHLPEFFGTLHFD